MLSEQELKEIDDWRFANRVATRSEAIRRLCQIGMFLEHALNSLEKSRNYSNVALMELAASLGIDLDRDVEESDRTAFMAASTRAEESRGDSSRADGLSVKDAYMELFRSAFQLNRSIDAVAEISDILAGPSSMRDVLETSQVLSDFSLLMMDPDFHIERRKTKRQADDG